MADVSPNAVVKDKSTRVLLDRRAEIRAEINKLEAEYQAIGDVLMKIYNYEHYKKIDSHEER